MRDAKARSRASGQFERRSFYALNTGAFGSNLVVAKTSAVFRRIDREQATETKAMQLAAIAPFAWAVAGQKIWHPVK